MEEGKTVMRMSCGVLLAALAAAAWAQQAPVLLKAPSVTDTAIGGTAQGMTSDYSAVLIYVCTSSTQAVAGTDCSGANVNGSGPVKKQALVNLGGAPFVVTAQDGKFAVTIAGPLAPGTYVWVAQVTLAASTRQPTIKTSQVMRVPLLPTPRVPVIRKVSLNISGTDSASRDLGGRATLDLQHGQETKGIGLTELLLNGSYDDRWKSKTLSSNVSQLYSGELVDFWQLRSGTNATVYFAPRAVEYHNNTQGVRVEQAYGAGLEQIARLGKKKTDSLALAFWPQAMLENIYAPGKSVNLFGVNLMGDLDLPFGNNNQWGVETKLTYTPALTETHDWNTTGSWTLTVPLSQRWSMNFTVIDNYYEIAPLTFDKNYLQPSIGFMFKNAN